MSHGDRVEHLPEGFEVLASTPDSPFAVVGDVHSHRYGLQFHPEVDHTEGGVSLLEQFALQICNAPQEWTPAEIIEDIYLKDVQRSRARTDVMYSGYYYSGPSSTERMIIENKNTPLELIVKISASSPDDRNRTLAFRTMARRS